MLDMIAQHNPIVGSIVPRIFSVTTITRIRKFKYNLLSLKTDFILDVVLVSFYTEP